MARMKDHQQVEAIATCGPNKGRTYVVSRDSWDGRGCVNPCYICGGRILADYREVYHIAVVQAAHERCLQVT